MKHAIIAGGGIGGLSAALALREIGWSVEVFERAAQLEDVGSGIAISPNGLRALDRFGAGDAVRDVAGISGAAGIRRHDGRWLAKTHTVASERAFGDTTVVLERPRMVDLLAKRLGQESIRLGVTVQSVDADAGVVTTDHGEYAADLIVAADGVRSRIRTALFPEHPPPRFSGQICWRTLVHAPGVQATAAEYWGSGQLAGTFPLKGDQVYVYASARRAAGEPTQLDHRRDLLELFGSWAAPIPQLMAAAATPSILRNDVYFMDTPLPAFHRGTVVLVGDAAHAMTPNLGQGACQAIEDGVVLAHALRSGLGLAEYSRLRLPRTSMIVSKSRSFEKLALLRNPLAIAARNTLMWLSGLRGPDFAVKQVEPVYGWRAPRLDEPPIR